MRCEASSSRKCSRIGRRRRRRANQRMKLTGAAMLVSRGMKVLQAAPAAYPYRSASRRSAVRTLLPALLAVAMIAFAGQFDPALTAAGQEKPANPNVEDIEKQWRISATLFNAGGKVDSRRP